MINEKIYVRYDLIGLLLLFMLISLISIYNAEQLEQYEGQNFMLKQAVWFGLGLTILIFVQFFDLETIYKLSLACYLVGILLLIVLHFSPSTIAPAINTAKSWFKFGGVSFQPSEVTKITTILYLAAIISKHKAKFESTTVTTDFFLLGKLILVGIIPIAFIMMQPDFGTSMVLLSIVIALIFLSGIRWSIILSISLTVAIFIGITVLLVFRYPDIAQSTLNLENYQMDRLETWLGLSEDSSNSENKTYHFQKSLLAVSSGQLMGKGIHNLEVYIPEAQTDFIFSIIGESFGFLGCSFVLILYFCLIYRLVTLGLKIYHTNYFGAYLCFGYLFLIFIHTFQNIGMTIGIMPITGIPLLLISYGGSSVLASMIGYALIYKVSCEYQKQEMYLFK
ncbi:FtsW/RodA/SpoVE family cell cycle protein [Aquibacillus koreensis]|uniref:FtsW/RodA/SpoVE family cell cycle protein n=1 Tax=Aquibacillus koreensis TaxID=279446 RepID=A0A9X4AK07_9BACI|nr:FtsW/RodA/SpoVE family cell cycle protein [Aquibacillus koreensis]MCT2535259.1 FtsW/RodA/SpoVE family cell cycle protein [Aquibacillus koreensis]MDC3422782.1 FtsW/RodA/SpoVE family cell cycle protein [Aquibacillus koreensis]